MSGELAIRFSTRAQADIRRITNELSDLQRQVASGVVASDLQGFGGASSRLLSARAAKASTDAQVSVITQLQARFGVQGAALGQVADATNALALSIREALASNDGRGISTELTLTFGSIIAALNQTWNGQPLFAGERQAGGGPIRVQSLDELLTAVTPQALYDEADRNQVIDLGYGAPVALSAKASDLSQGLFDTLRGLKQMLVGAGGTIGQPISGQQHDALLDFVYDLGQEATAFTNEQGQSGQLERHLETDLVRLQERSDFIAKEIGEQADADLGEVSIRLSSLMAQYEASAKTFADLSRLTLLNYL